MALATRFSLKCRSALNVAEVQDKDTSQAGERVGMEACFVTSRDDQLRLSAIEVRAPITDDPVGAFDAIAISMPQIRLWAFL
jgi:hypothetical protein